MVPDAVEVNRQLNRLTLDFIPAQQFYQIGTTTTINADSAEISQATNRNNIIRLQLASNINKITVQFTNCNLPIMTSNPIAGGSISYTGNTLQISSDRQGFSIPNNSRTFTDLSTAENELQTQEIEYGNSNSQVNVVSLLCLVIAGNNAQYQVSAIISDSNTFLLEDLNPVDGRYLFERSAVPLQNIQLNLQNLGDNLEIVSITPLDVPNTSIVIFYNDRDGNSQSFNYDGGDLTLEDVTNVRVALNN